MKPKRRKTKVVKRAEKIKKIAKVIARHNLYGYRAHMLEAEAILDAISPTKHSRKRK